MHLRPALPSDLPTVAAIVCSSFGYDELYTYTNPYLTQYPDSFYACMLLKVKQSFIKLGFQVFVCVSDDRDSEWLPAALASDAAKTSFGRLDTLQPSGEVVLGYAAWHRQGPKDLPTVKAWAQSHSGIRDRLDASLYLIQSKYSDLLGIDRSLNKSQRHTVRDLMNRIDQPLAPALTDGKPGFWFLQVISTSLIARRKGVARMLLQWGIDRAIDEDVPVCVNSSALGINLYHAAGFKVIHWSPMFQGGSTLVYDPESRWTRPLEDEEEGAWFERDGQKLRVQVAWK